MTRAQDQARERLNFAKERIASMNAEQRAALTEERLIGSFGIARPEAAILIRQHCGR